MHYRNGREAKEGDSVVGPGFAGRERIVAGTIHSLNPGCQTCNAQVAVPMPGGVTHTAVTVGNFLHAEDAFEAGFNEGAKDPKTDEPTA